MSGVDNWKDIQLNNYLHTTSVEFRRLHRTHLAGFSADRCTYTIVVGAGHW